MTAPSDDPLIGESLPGRYRVERCIAEGRTARIYEIVHSLLGQRAVAKIQFAEQARLQAASHRFFAEAKYLSRVHHRAVVKVLDFNAMVVPLPTNLILMEHVAGRTLEALLLAGPLPPPRATAIAAEVARCLHAAHEVGIAHRGLRAAEVMLIERGPDAGRVKLLDWGDAEEPESEAELLAARAADQRALGHLLQQLLHGSSPPGQGRVTGPIPVSLQALVARATAPLSEAQYPSLAELAQALELGPEARPEDEVVLRFCPRCGGQSIDTSGYGSPWTGTCRDCGCGFTLMMIPMTETGAV